MNFVNSFDLFGTAAKQTTCITLHGVPTATTEGAVGLFGIDVDSEDKVIYKCTEVTADGKYVWKALLEDEGYESRSIIDSAEGSLISLTNAAKAPLPKVKIYGKSTQASTTGKNKLPYPYVQSTINSNGISIVVNNDSSITINGTETAGVYTGIVLNNTLTFEDGKTYTISYNSTATNIQIYISYKDAEGTTKYVMRNGSLTWSSDYTFASINVQIIPNGTYSNVVVYPILVEGSTYDGVWEPYTGGIPSPNPNYPQEITSVGDSGSVDLKVQGQNLLPYPYHETTKTTRGIRYTDNGDGSFIVSGTAADGNASFYMWLSGDVPFVAGQTYRKYCNSETCHLIIHYVDGKGTSVYISNNSTFVWKDDYALKHIYLQVSSGYSASDVVYPIIVAGSTYDGVWEPPKPIQSATFETPDGLRRIPEVNAYDEIDTEKGVRIQRIYKKVFDGTENIKSNTGTNVNQFYTPLDMKGKINGNGFSLGYCTHTPANTTGAYTAFNVTGATTTILNTYVWIYLPEFSTVDDVKAFMSEQYANGTPFTIYYELETPIETPLTDEEIVAFKALRTHKPYTTIHASGCCDAKVDYVVDPKLYIDNKINKAVEELSAAIITE